MTQELEFEVHGPPVPKARHRSFQTSSGMQTRTPAATKAWENHVQAISIAALQRWRQSNGFERWVATGAFGLSIVFYLKGRRGRDLSNLIKAVEDGMNGVVYNDDEQIDRYGEMRRVYGSPAPRAVVRVWRVEADAEGPLE